MFVNLKIVFIVNTSSGGEPSPKFLTFAPKTVLRFRAKSDENPGKKVAKVHDGTIAYFEQK
jgi:hypothetical protein